MDGITSQFPSQLEFETGYAPARVKIRKAAVRVWDLPTRVFHWTLLLCVSGAVISAQLGGNWMDWHVRCGAATAGLLAFRLVWGLVGPRYARFLSFLHAPRTVLADLFKRSARTRHAGHSPSGGASVFALLGVLGALVLSGLLSSDSISTDGALVRYASESTVTAATALHHKLQWVIYGLVALHVLAVFAYLVLKRIDLIRPMLHGDKRGVRAPHAADSLGVRVIGLGLMFASVATALRLLA